MLSGNHIYVVMQEKIIFKIGKISTEIVDCNKQVVKATNKFVELLKNLDYDGTLRESNSRQLDIHFDEALLNKLLTCDWSYSESPSVDITAIGKEWGKPKSDIIIYPKDLYNYPVVVEIEKANKKTMWFDFIKLWMFIEAKQAKVGILLCPFNYSHRHGVWNLFEEACTYKRYLRRFAGVKKEKLSVVSIIGYQQMIYIDNKFQNWDKKQFNRLKGNA